MIKKFLLLPIFLMACIANVQAQDIFKGRVLDSDTKEGLAFVNIIINDKEYGTATDIDGMFELPGDLDIRNLSFSYIGYEGVQIPMPKPVPVPWIIELSPNAYLLQEVELTPGVNPAHRIIKNAVNNKKLNEPTKLDAFSYSSYNKFLVRLNTDSADIPEAPESSEDSSMVEASKFSEKQHIFLLESVSKRSFIEGKRDNEEVLASRVSGLEDPTFVLLANELQSFSFYDDYITVLDEKYLNPISQNSWNKYVFILEDTLYDGADTSFVISYRPSVKSNFDGLRGRLTIHSREWAIQNVTAEPANQLSIRVRIFQKYEFKENKAWFPVQLYTDIDFLSLSFNGITIVGEGRTYLDSIRINPDLNKKKIPNVEITLDGKATKKDEDFWNQYRKDTLTPQEQETYRVIDSIGKAENLDVKLKAIQALLTGKWRTGYIDWDLNRLLIVNTYEDVRLGVGAHTNERLWRRFQVGGYVGYGFRDYGWKYGGDFNTILNEYHDVRWKLSFDKDIPESGGTEFISDPWVNPINSLRLLNVKNRDKMERWRTSFSFRPRSNMILELGVQTQSREKIETYSYVDDSGIASSEIYQTTEAIACWTWSPNSKYMQTQYGLVSVKKEFPEVTLQFTQGFQGVMEGQFDYSRIDLRFDHRIQFRGAGQMFFQIFGGYNTADLPASYLYNGRGNRDNIISDVQSFELMSSSRFLSDAHIDLLIEHRFGKIVRKPSFEPEFSLVARASYGTLRTSEKHISNDYTTMENGYFETGFIISKIFGSLGLGVYYQLGNYSSDNWLDNIALKFHFSTDFLQ